MKVWIEKIAKYLYGDIPMKKDVHRKGDYALLWFFRYIVGVIMPFYFLIFMSFDSTQAIKASDNPILYGIGFSVFMTVICYLLSRFMHYVFHRNGGTF